MTVKKHLTLSQRIIIENGLREGKKINLIAREAKVSRSTVAAIHAAFLGLQYPMMFGILLGDRGTEFGDPETLESFAKDGKVFYCDPGKPGQKGGIGLSTWLKASMANP